MRTISRSILVVGLAAIAGTGCEDTTGPERGVDTLILVSVGESPVPAVVADMPDLLIQVVADTIRFPEEGKFERTRLLRVTGLDGTPTELSSTVVGNVEWRDGVFALIPMCAAGGDCLPYGELVPESGGYRMEMEVVDGVFVTHHFRIGEGS